MREREIERSRDRESLRGVSRPNGNVIRKRERDQERSRGISRPNIMFALFACCVFLSIRYNSFNYRDITEALLVSLPVSLPEIKKVSVMSSTDTKMLLCLKQILLNRELPIIPQLSVYSNGTPRTALNGKNQEVPFLGAHFAHHGDTGDYKRWNKSIQMARASPMPQLEHGTEKLPCIVLEIGAHRAAQSSQEHIKKYPNCEYHAYEVIPQFAEELKELWKDEPRMHVHPYGLAENDMEIKVHINALDGLSTFVGNSVTGKNLDEKTTVTGQIRAFDFALSEIGQLHNREADAVIPTLLDINCEGCEYNLLLEAKKHGFIERVPVVLIGWHAYGEDGVGARAWQLCQVRAMLSETHEMAYGLGFGWERWILRA